MTGRAKRKPLEVHLLDGNKAKISSVDKEAYAAAEIDFGDLSFHTPDDIKKDKLALKKWREVTKIYKDAELTVVSNTDTGIIARYCKLYSEYWQLLDVRQQINDFPFPETDEQELLAETDAEYRRDRARRLWNIMEYLTRLDGVFKIDDKIHRKLKAILSIEDRIFLNPAAKVRTLPIRRKKPEKDPVSEMGFNV